MGLISKIKKLFSNKIDATDVSDNELISLVSNQAIKFGKKLEVPQNFVAVFVAKGKVADVFNEGSYRLEVGCIPILTRILKLTKPDRKGNLPNRFSAQLYLINLKPFLEQKFASFNSVLIKDKKYKNLKVRLEGKFDFQIINSVDFVEAMLTQYGLIKESIARREISCWVAELTTKRVQKNKPKVEDLHARATKCFEGVIDYVNKDLFDCGVKITSIEVTNTIFPKKVFKSVKLDYTELTQNQPAQTVEELNYNKNDKTDVISNINENLLESSATSKDSLNNVETNETDCENIQNICCQNSVNNENIQIDVENKNYQTNNKNENAPEPDIVNTVGYKVCLNCGAYNSVNSEHCFKCKSKI